ncbi:MAG TPA: CBS domain-containing protein [Nitrosomonas nitrosa]|uniref:Histidine kinase n=1 Tax=Nitrosomonas nitrosa TaxID=52442 RepID=A0A8E0R920_9PROT|nr:MULTISPECIES: CBS domain-containing protein [Nitrosomonas]MCW5601882.1 CBS domain-containing protein [Nitrosomonas sp.]PTQ97494.1 CBS domain protein [Nitrosomonas nitrosa]CAE6514258.1 Histidine kinase [Nitrosomonas nitrosa]HBZ29145.1 CBS domain-containing protein [Nitrosomonas nitrosa]HNP50334.1 CBS domain-containing protein [Nitrosomonas nitrosa]
MSIGEICNREVVVVQPEDTVLQAAKLMRQHHVGSVLVVDQHNGKPVPVGIVTDRDLVVEVMATELDPETITVSDIMVPDFAMVKEETGVFETIQYMRNKSVRRLPVVDKEGRLIGIIALDDLLTLLSEELDALAKLVAREQKKETNTRR